MKETLSLFFRLALGLKSRDRFQLGVVAVVQTFGDRLNFHPHVHALVAEGVFQEGVFTPCPLQAHDMMQLEKIFQAKVLQYLVRQSLLDLDLAEKMLSWKHTGFSVNADVQVYAEDHDLLLRLLRYMARPAVSFAE